MTDFLCMNYTPCQWNEVHIPRIVPLPDHCVEKMKIYELQVAEGLEEIADKFSLEGIFTGEELLNKFVDYKRCLRELMKDRPLSIDHKHLKGLLSRYEKSQSYQFLAALSSIDPFNELLITLDNPEKYKFGVSPSEETFEYDMKKTFDYILDALFLYLNPAMSTLDVADDGPGPVRNLVQSVLKMNREFLKNVVINNKLYQIPAFMMHRNIGVIFSASVIKALSLSISPQISLPPFFFDLALHADSFQFVERYFHLLYAKDLAEFKSSIIKLVLSKHPEAVDNPDILLRFDFSPLQSAGYKLEDCFGFNNPLNEHEISQSIPSELEDDQNWRFPSYTYRTLINEYLPSMERRIIIEFQEYLKKFRSNFGTRNLQIFTYFLDENIISQELNTEGSRTDLLQYHSVEQREDLMATLLGSEDYRISSMIPGKTYTFKLFVKIFYQRLLPEKLIPSFYVMTTGTIGRVLRGKGITWVVHQDIPLEKDLYNFASVFGEVMTKDLVYEIIGKLFEFEKEHFNEPEAIMPPLPTHFFPASIMTCQQQISVYGVKSSVESLLSILFHFNYNMNYFSK